MIIYILFFWAFSEKLLWRCNVITTEVFFSFWLYLNSNKAWSSFGWHFCFKFYFFCEKFQTGAIQICFWDFKSKLLHSLFCFKRSLSLLTAWSFDFRKTNLVQKSSNLSSHLLSCSTEHSQENSRFVYKKHLSTNRRRVSSASLESLFQCAITLTVQKCFLILKVMLACYLCAFSILLVFLGELQGVLRSSWPPLLWSWQSKCPQLLIRGHAFLPCHQVWYLLWILPSVPVSSVVLSQVHPSAFSFVGFHAATDFPVLQPI